MRYGRKALRDIRAMGWRAVMLILVIGVGPGMAVGVSLALHDVRVTRDTFYSQQRLADLDLRLATPVSQAGLRGRAEAAGANPVETRLILDGSVTLPSGHRSQAQVVGMAPDAPLNQLALLSGEGLSAGDPAGAVAEADFAHLTGVAPGDTLTVTLGGRQLRLHLRGLVRSPEYLLATASPQYLIPQPGSLAVLFLPRAGLQQLLGLAGQVNDVAMDVPASTTTTAVAATVARGLPVANQTTRTDQFSYRFTNADIRSFSMFTPLLGGIFAAVGLLLLALSLHRMVAAQRRELGALLALGYRRRAVVLTVLVPAGLLALAGAAVAAATTVGVAALVATEYATAVGFPAVVHSYAAGSLLLAAGIAVAATVAAAGLPAWAVSRLRPSDAMRGETPPRFRLPAWSRRGTGGGPLRALALRGLLRRPVRTAATVISLAAAIGLGAALAILATSTVHDIDAAFAHQRWSHTLDLTAPTGQARAVALAAGDPAQAVVSGPVQLRTGTASPVTGTAAANAGGTTAGSGRSAAAELVGLAAAPRLDRLDIVTGTAPAAGRIVLSQQLATTLGVRVGDPVRLTTAAGSADVTVAGLARTLANQRVYLPFADAGALLGLPGQATGLYLEASPAAAQRLAADPRVARVTSKADAVAGMHALTRELTGLIRTLQAISLAVGALFLVSSLTLSHLDRGGEFAVLQALGYRRRQIAAIVTTEALIHTAVAAALAVPVALLTAWILARRIGQAWFAVSLAPAPADYLLSIVAALLLATLAAAQATRRITRADLAAAVRARQIG